MSIPFRTLQARDINCIRGGSGVLELAFENKLRQSFEGDQSDILEIFIEHCYISGNRLAFENMEGSQSVSFLLCLHGIYILEKGQISTHGIKRDTGYPENKHKGLESKDQKLSRNWHFELQDP